MKWKASILSLKRLFILFCFLSLLVDCWLSYKKWKFKCEPQEKQPVERNWLFVSRQLGWDGSKMYQALQQAGIEIPRGIRPLEEDAEISRIMTKLMQHESL